MKQAVVLAGGLATRMLPRTRDVPKYLLEVAGRPFAFWQLELLARAGFDRVLLCVAHLGDRIRDVVGDGRAFGLAIAYADEGPALLGTAGAIRAAAHELDETFLVTYGDSYLPFDYAAPLDDLRAHPDALGTMAVYANRGRFDASNCAIEGELVTRYEKRSAPDPALDHIDYGATALRREVILALPEGAAAGLDSIQRDLAARGRLRAFVAEDRFYEIGSEQGLEELDRVLRSPR